jgi:hypothetical protein
VRLGHHASLVVDRPSQEEAHPYLVGLPCQEAGLPRQVAGRPSVAGTQVHQEADLCPGIQVRLEVAPCCMDSCPEVLDRPNPWGLGAPWGHLALLGGSHALPAEARQQKAALTAAILA